MFPYLVRVGVGVNGLGRLGDGVGVSVLDDLGVGVLVDLGVSVLDSLGVWVLEDVGVGVLDSLGVWVLEGMGVEVSVAVMSTGMVAGSTLALPWLASTQQPRLELSRMLYQVLSKLRPFNE